MVQLSDGYDVVAVGINAAVVAVVAVVVVDGDVMADDISVD